MSKELSRIRYAYLTNKEGKEWEIGEEELHIFTKSLIGVLVRNNYISIDVFQTLLVEIDNVHNYTTKITKKYSSYERMAVDYFTDIKVHLSTLIDTKECYYLIECVYRLAMINKGKELYTIIVMLEKDFDYSPTTVSIILNNVESKVEIMDLGFHSIDSVSLSALVKETKDLYMDYARGKYKGKKEEIFTLDLIKYEPLDTGFHYYLLSLNQRTNASIWLFLSFIYRVSMATGKEKEYLTNVMKCPCCDKKYTYDEWLDGTERKLRLSQLPRVDTEIKKDELNDTYKDLPDHLFLCPKRECIGTNHF